MTESTEFSAGVNIAMKVPAAAYDATVSFYRDVLGFTVTEEGASSTPSIARTHAVRFGPNTLWLDCSPTATEPAVWLELSTTDLDGATKRLAAAGIMPQDELEPIVGAAAPYHWVKNPAGVVHLLRAGDG